MMGPTDYRVRKTGPMMRRPRGRPGGPMATGRMQTRLAQRVQMMRGESTIGELGLTLKKMSRKLKPKEVHRHHRPSKVHQTVHARRPTQVAKKPALITKPAGQIHKEMNPVAAEKKARAIHKQANPVAAHRAHMEGGRALHREWKPTKLSHKVGRGFSSIGREFQESKFSPKNVLTESRQEKKAKARKKLNAPTAAEAVEQQYEAEVVVQPGETGMFIPEGVETEAAETAASPDATDSAGNVYNADSETWYTPAGNEIDDAQLTDEQIDLADDVEKKQTRGKIMTAGLIGGALYLLTML